MTFYHTTDIKEMIRGIVTFQFYRDSILYYKTENGFVFEVPISDAGGATFLKEDKGILFMRYIRKSINKLNNGE